MTKRRLQSANGAGQGRKLKVKKETLKDLDVKGKARKVKGGAIIVERGTNCLLCSVSCMPPPLVK